MSKVLIVDDEKIYCDQLSLILSHERYQVHAAPNVEKGIRLGREFRPDILVVDWRLADEGNGMEVARALASVIPALPTILITGCLLDEIPQEVRESAFRVLEKPFSIDEVVTAVRDATRSLV